MSKPPIPPTEFIPLSRLHEEPPPPPRPPGPGEPGFLPPKVIVPRVAHPGAPLSGFSSDPATAQWRVGVHQTQRRTLLAVAVLVLAVGALALWCVFAVREASRSEPEPAQEAGR